MSFWTEVGSQEIPDIFPQIQNKSSNSRQIQDTMDASHP